MLERIPRKVFPGLTPLVFIAALLVLAGCAGPLVMDYSPVRQDGPVVKVSGPARVYVDGFKDERPAEGPSRRGSRVIGGIDAVVANMRGNELVVDRDVTSIVEEAFSVELAEAGYTVAAERAGADVVVAGVVRSFEVNIEERDEISLDIAADFTDPSGRVVWSGGETYRHDRYAGVLGNSRGSIEKYINASLTTAVGTIIGEATPVVSAGISGAGGPPAVAAPSSPAAVSGQAAPSIPEGKGRLDIDTGPVRAKVYLDGVYYGLTPVTLDIEPGVYGLTLKHDDGQVGLSEKVSVREGQTTEMEADLGEE